MKTKGHQKNEDSKNRMLERDREALERKGNFRQHFYKGLRQVTPFIYTEHSFL